MVTENRMPEMTITVEGFQLLVMLYMTGVVRGMGRTGDWSTRGQGLESGKISGY